MLFFFQAEDGIRYLVRSRGLGDVYKRQVETHQLLDGVRASSAIREQIKIEAVLVTRKRNRSPHLAAVLVGEDAASQTYVSSKVKSCEEVGFRSTLLRKPVDTTEVELLALVAQLNADAEVCLLYTSDAADERSSVDLGGRRIIKKKNKKKNTAQMDT